MLTKFSKSHIPLHHKNTSQNFKIFKITYTTLYISPPPCYSYTMNQTNPFEARKVILRIEMIDADGNKKGVRGAIFEEQLIKTSDPRKILFSALQEMSHKLVTESFQTEPVNITPPVLSRTREEENEAIADMVKLVTKGKG